MNLTELFGSADSKLTYSTSYCPVDFVRSSLPLVESKVILAEHSLMPLYIKNMIVSICLNIYHSGEAILEIAQICASNRRQGNMAGIL